MTYLLDTTAYSELLRGHEVVAKVVRSADQILLPNVVIAELQYGFRLGTKQQENDRLLSRFIASKKVRTLLADNATTGYFVDIAIFARQKGVQLSSHDLWIVALAEQWDATLLTFDKDFHHLGYDSLKIQLES
jgi:predicted nucleic acid-binding protein